MATLADLLALLPDNDTGAIDAADLRTIVTALWDAGADVAARVGALEASGSSGDQVAVSGVWQVNPNAGPSPGGKQVTCDTGLFASASFLFFDKQDKSNRDFTTIMKAVTAIYAQEEKDASNWVRYTLNGLVLDQGSYLEVPVSVVASSGTTGAASWQDAAVVITAAVQ